MLTFRDQAFLASVKSGGFAPPDFGNMVLWLQPDSLSALANNDPVSTWPDDSSFGNDLIQSTGLNQPIYKTAQLNGNAGVDFDGLNHYMSVTPLITTSTDYSVFIVMQFDSATGTETPFKNGELAGWAVLKLAGNRSILHRGIAASDDGLATAVAELWTAIRTNTGPLLSFRVDAVAEAVTNSGSAETAPDTITYLGQFGTGGPLYFAGLMFEVMVWDVALSTTDRDIVEAYLLTKYGL